MAVLDPLSGQRNTRWIKVSVSKHKVIYTGKNQPQLHLQKERLRNDHSHSWSGTLELQIQWKHYLLLRLQNKPIKQKTLQCHHRKPWFTASSNAMCSSGPLIPSRIINAEIGSRGSKGDQRHGAASVWGTLEQFRSLQVGKGTFGDEGMSQMSTKIKAAQTACLGTCCLLSFLTQEVAGSR